MNFEYTDEQRQLADAVEKRLGSAYGFEQRKAILGSGEGFSPALWATFAEMGLTAIALPEGDGGFGGGAVDLLAPMQACGAALVVEPLVDTLVAARLLAGAGSGAQRAAWLPGVIDGSARLSLAWLEPGSRYDAVPLATTARRDAGGWRLAGEKGVVVGAAAATRLLVSARETDGGCALFLVDPAAAGVALNPYRTADGLRAADLKLADAPAERLGDAGDAQPLLDEALDFAAALLCADALGAMQYACDATLEYTKTRKQFGVPIASFQVLQHRMVEMFICTEQARSMVIRAAAAVDAGGDARVRSRIVSAAMVKVIDAARQVSQEAVQLHGGMGMSEELKISHTFRRLTMAQQRFGGADHHLERYAALA